MAEQGAAPFDMAALAALVRETVELSVAPLREEMAQIRGATPKFTKVVPPNPSGRRARSYEPPAQLLARALRGIGRGQNASGQTSWYDSPEGRRTVPVEYWPVFGPGDIVRLNPDARMHGSDKTWGEVLAGDTRNPDGIGEVTGTAGYTDNFEPKYRLSISGFSGGVVGMRESELLPYDG